MEIVFFILALVSEIIGTIGGFGSSVFFVPLAAMFFPPKTVLGLTALFHVFSNLSKLYLFREHINLSLLSRFGLPSIIGVIVGAFLSVFFVATSGTLILGFFLLLFAVLFLLKPSLQIAPTRTNAIAGGSAAGFFAGLIGTGGALRGAIMASYNLEKQVFVATSAAVDMGVDLTRSAIYVGNDYVSLNDAWYIPGLIAVSFVGSLIGKYVLNFISQEVFRKFVLVLIGIIGIVSIVHYLYFVK
ncbi:MAG: sulfite exporter TauE/SafE family protein [Bacteroidia bacterium]